MSSCCFDGQFCDFPWCDCDGNAEWRRKHGLKVPADVERDCGEPSCNYCRQTIRPKAADGAALSLEVAAAAAGLGIPAAQLAGALAGVALPAAPSVELLTAAALAAIRYDEEIQKCANDPDAMSSHCTAEGDTLDTLYTDWISKARAAIADVLVAGADVRADGIHVGLSAGAPGATDAERAAWLADKIGALGDYAKEAAAMLRRWPAAGVPVPDEADARRGRYVVRNAEWRRNEGRTYLMVRVPDGADLSCVATRENALDAAIAGVLASDGGQQK